MRTPASPRPSTTCPQTLRRASTTFVDLRATLDDLDKLVAVSKPASKNLAPFLATLRPLLVEAKPTVGQLATLLQAAGREQRLHRPAERLAGARDAGGQHVPRVGQGAEQGRAGPRVHPPVRAGHDRLVPRLRPERRQLRRERPLRAHRAALQLLQLRPGHEPADAGDRRPSACPACRRARRRSPAARAGPRRRRPTAARRGGAPAETSTAIPRSCPRVNEAPDRHRRRRRRGRRADRLRDRVEQRQRRLPGARDLQQRRVRDPRHGRAHRRRRRRQHRVDRPHRRQEGRGRPEDREQRLPGLPQGRLLHDPPAVADRRALHRVRADAAEAQGLAAAAAARARWSRGRAPASTCCRRRTRRARSTWT